MLSDSRRESVTAAQVGGCFSAKMSLTDFHAVSLLQFCPQGILESSGKTPLESAERSLRAAVTLLNHISWSIFSSNIIRFQA